jgi:hypothetical protein
MTDPAIQDQVHVGNSSPSLARWLLGGGAACLLAAGLLLWLREGDRLFTEGLIAAIAGCC